MPPPPPVPLFWNETAVWEPCFPMCHLLPTNDVSINDLTIDYHSNTSSSLSADSVISVACACVMGLTLGTVLLMFVWYKRSRSSSPSLPPSIQSRSSDTEYTCPVVNVKPPQSINLGPRSTSAYSNTLNVSRGSGFSYDPVNGQLTVKRELKGTRTLMPNSVLHPLNYEDQYTAMREPCSSSMQSPVYAELDGNGSHYAVGMAYHHQQQPRQEESHYYVKYSGRGGAYYSTQPRHPDQRHDHRANF